MRIWKQNKFQWEMNQGQNLTSWIWKRSGCHRYVQSSDLGCTLFSSPLGTATAISVLWLIYSWLRNYVDLCETLRELMLPLIFDRMYLSMGQAIRALVLGSLWQTRFGTAAPIMDEITLMGKLRGDRGKGTSTLTITNRIVCIRHKTQRPNTT